MQRMVKYSLSPDSCRRSTSCAKSSIPVLKDSRERDMCPSWEFGERFSAIARCRSRSESLMWSARRKSCEEFDIVLKYWMVRGWHRTRYGGCNKGQGPRRMFLRCGYAIWIYRRLSGGNLRM